MERPAPRHRGTGHWALGHGGTGHWGHQGPSETGAQECLQIERPSHPRPSAKPSLSLPDVFSTLRRLIPFEKHHFTLPTLFQQPGDEDEPYRPPLPDAALPASPAELLHRPDRRLGSWRALLRMGRRDELRRRQDPRRRPRGDQHPLVRADLPEPTGRRELLQTGRRGGRGRRTRLRPLAAAVEGLRAHVSHPYRPRRGDRGGARGLSLLAGVGRRAGLVRGPGDDERRVGRGVGRVRARRGRLSETTGNGESTDE